MQSRRYLAQAMLQLLCRHPTAMMSSSVVGELRLHARAFVYQVQVTCKCLKHGNCPKKSKLCFVGAPCVTQHDEVLQVC